MQLNPRQIAQPSVTAKHLPAVPGSPGARAPDLPDWPLPFSWTQATEEFLRIWAKVPPSPEQPGAVHGPEAHLKQSERVPGAPAAIDPPLTVDRLLHAAMGQMTNGVSPISLALAYVDWTAHLAISPGRCLQLWEKGLQKALRFACYAAAASSDPTCATCIEPLVQDKRFRHEAWHRWPFNVIQQAFLLNQAWWHNATSGVGGVSSHHEHMASFMARQLLDIVSPVNFVATNPEVLEATFQQGGQNLLRGVMNQLAELGTTPGGEQPAGSEGFVPGKNVAVTKGDVVYRNRLIELIQYSPVTDDVHAEPILIVPAWIMKYYILDLSPHNSLVRYLVGRGHTVFMISWHNPSPEDRDIGMEDYLRLGALEALKVVQTIVPGRKVNAAGYCLGGTLLSMAAAYLAREGDSSINSVTLLAAQTDFTEPGELRLFIDESQVTYLEDIMWQQGYLDTTQMSGAFQILQSSEFIWSHMARQRLLGLHPPKIDFDLMAWNADTTRMPYRMHSEYLRRLFLNNDLFEARYQLEGRPVVLSDISAPIFAVTTETDHVAPWRSVFKINVISDADVTFVLTTGGHNAGIVSEPGHRNRHFRVSHRSARERYVDPDTWYRSIPATDGSWWPVWAEWLEAKSTGREELPATGAPDKGYSVLGAAPGQYVHER